MFFVRNASFTADAQKRGVTLQERISVQDKRVNILRKMRDI